MDFLCWLIGHKLTLSNEPKGPWKLICERCTVSLEGSKILHRYEWYFPPFNNIRPWIAYIRQGNIITMSLNLLGWHFTITGIPKA